MSAGPGGEGRPVRCVSPPLSCESAGAGGGGRGGWEKEPVGWRRAVHYAFPPAGTLTLRPSGCASPLPSANSRIPPFLKSSSHCSAQVPGEGTFYLEKWYFEKKGFVRRNQSCSQETGASVFAPWECLGRVHQGLA